jgi:hypothetical protein
MLQNGDFTSWDTAKALPQHWSLEQHESCRAAISRPRGLPGDAIKIEIGTADDAQWHLQLTQGGFRLTNGQYYTLSFEASSPKARTISCGVSQAHSPWSNLGLSRGVSLDPEWKTFSFGFVATASDTNARVTFAFSGDPTPFHLAHVELRPGGQVGLAEGESLDPGTIELFRDKESTPRILDRMTFLAQTEKAYFEDMWSHIRGLGCRALVTGTIVFGPLGLYAQSNMDFLDSHAYWQHPRFPGKPWDPGNWTVEQRPMTDHPSEATLFRLAAERRTGKPFTLSEYNHPAPLDAQAECVPMIASFAAAQDWDGVWLYTYSHSTDNWGREHLYSYFDIDTNPAKWGFMRAGAAIFVEKGIAPLPTPDSGLWIANTSRNLATLHLKYGTDMFRLATDTGGIVYQNMLRSQMTVSIDSRPGPVRDPQSATGTQLQWSVDAGGQGLYEAIGPQAQVYTGHANRFAGETEGRIRIVSPDFVALTITPLGAGGEVLITACGRCENTGMQFAPDRRTVGRNWGKAPVQIEPVRGTLTLPEGRWTCRALAPDGTPGRQAPVTYENGRGVLALSPEYATMWYLLERQEN